MNLDIYNEELHDLTKNIINKDKEILEKFPQSVAGGIILYYMECRGMDTNSKLTEFAKKVGYCKPTLQNMCRYIGDIDNS
jgi:hypothetical protein